MQITYEKNHGRDARSVTTIETPLVRVFRLREGVAKVQIMSPQIGVSAVAKLAGSDIGVLSYETVIVEIDFEMVDDLNREIASSVVDLRPYQVFDDEVFEGDSAS